MSFLSGEVHYLWYQLEKAAVMISACASICDVYRVVTGDDRLGSAKPKQKHGQKQDSGKAIR